MRFGCATGRKEQKSAIRLENRGENEDKPGQNCRERTPRAQRNSVD
jgi:hypothetical protein